MINKYNMIKESQLRWILKILEYGNHGDIVADDI